MTSVKREVVGIQGRGLSLVIVALVFAVVATATVIGRLLSRVAMKRSIGKDDYAMVLSLVCAIAFTIINCIGVSHGYGTMDDQLPKAELRSALKAFYACQIAYKLTMNLTKISILLLYRRIFPNRWFRNLVLLLLLAISLFAVGTTCASIMQCWPIYHNWDRTRSGKCIDTQGLWYANAAGSIISDLVILVIPLPLIINLQLPFNQKLGLVAVFSLGGFVCVTSVIRMTVLKIGATSFNPSYDTLKSTIWTAVECNTAIICASLPMLKGTLAKLFPKLFPRSQASNGRVIPGDPTPSQSTTQVNEVWDAPPLPGALSDKITPTLLEFLMHPEEDMEHAEIPLSDMSQTMPKVYSPKGPRDVITKTTDIRMKYTDHARDEEEDLHANDKIFRFGKETVIVPGPSRKTLPYRR